MLLVGETSLGRVKHANIMYDKQNPGQISSSKEAHENLLLLVYHAAKLKHIKSSHLYLRCQGLVQGQAASPTHSCNLAGDSWTLWKI